MDGEHVIIEAVPDYVSKYAQGQIFQLCWLCVMKLPQKPRKDFPHEGKPWPFCAESVSHVHLSQRKQSSDRFQLRV